ncbi:MAG: glycogen debranching enzyme family protein [Anaerolineales bacterium]|nr:glycogen debranching enzyme family protein [Anaerolineales bacterium]
MHIEFGREVWGNLLDAEKKEWLVTNGIGGYASGTIATTLTRRYHGYLVAALQPPLGRTVLVSKLDETVHYAGEQYDLFANRWVDGTISPSGYQYIERFYLENTTPVWEFAFSDALLEKRIWMQPGENTTYVQFRFLRGSSPIHLTARAMVNYRDYHSSTQGGWSMDARKVSHGLKITAFDSAIHFYLLSSNSSIDPDPVWYYRFALKAEQFRGFDGMEDIFSIGNFQTSLSPDESTLFAFSTNADPVLDESRAWKLRVVADNAILSDAQMLSEEIRPLALSADQFIVDRPSPQDPEGKSVIAGYPWFGDWGRDTMIALPGLTLSTGRPQIARSILRTFSYFIDQGMLPNRFPDEGERPEYNTVDATLWYFEALRAYLAATDDLELIADLFPALQDIIDWHVRGTRYHIKMDTEDGLLFAGEAGVQLTWMDAKAGDWVVTPRIGKPVEINALWYNALSSMNEFVARLGKPTDRYIQLADQVRNSFQRFWYAEGNYCYDVIDGLGNPDASLRPNQILAVSLPYRPLNNDQQQAVVDTIAKHLLTSLGLRSLARSDPAYQGHYGGDFVRRDGAYHQGTVWAWLIGHFVSAHLHVYHNPETARSFLHPLLNHLADHGLGTISEIFDGEPPFSPRGCIAQAWSVAEVIRAWDEIDKWGKTGRIE